MTIPELAERWGISRQQVYQRLNAAGISPLKRGRYSYLTPEMVAEMDEVDGLLRQGFSLRDVSSQTTGDRRQMTVDIQATPVIETPDHSAANGLEAFAQVLADAICKSSVVSNDNPLRSQQLLSQAADEGWVLSSKQIAECCGVSASTTHGWNRSVIKHGHRLERAGVGLWRIYRLEA